MYESQAELDAFFEQLYQFRQVRKLGEGAFGLAILVYDEVEEMHKVFKLPKTIRTTEALKQEGSNLRKLSELLHPNIIRLHQYGKVKMTWQEVEQDRYYLNMAFGGKSLRGRIGDLRTEFDENGNAVYRGSGIRLPIPDALRISIDVCRGLEAAHGFKGAPVRMIHRDIKPDNILVDDESGIARITDFGISRVIDRSTQLASIAGTLLYMDPECFMGRATTQCDVYSLGVVMYELITGDLPFHNFESRIDHLPTPAHEIVENCPVDLSEAIQRALEPRVDNRFEGAGELLRDLNRIHARLNPLPERYVRQAEMPDGSLLCDDLDEDRRVVVRIASTTAVLPEFARHHEALRELVNESIRLPLRQFRNEQFVGVVHPVDEAPTLLAAFPEGERRRVASLERMCSAVQQAAEVLVDAHLANVVHGMLSPHQIVLLRDGVVVRELGQSAFVRARHFGGHSPESVEGWSPLLAYASPQVLDASREPTPADDVYALAACLYHVVTGRTPLDDRDRAALLVGGEVAERLVDPRSLNRYCPGTLADPLLEALQWNPHDRTPTMAAFRDALAAVRWPEDVVESLLEDALRTFPEGGDDTDLVAACELLDDALHVAPGSLAAHRARGLVYQRHGSWQFAIEEYEKVLRVEPTPELHRLLGECCARVPERHKDAVRHLRSALQHREAADVLSTLAGVLWSLGRHDQARGYLEKSIALEEDSSARERRKIRLGEWRSGRVSGPVASPAMTPPHPRIDPHTIVRPERESDRDPEPERPEGFHSHESTLGGAPDAALPAPAADAGEVAEDAGDGSATPPDEPPASERQASEQPPSETSASERTDEFPRAAPTEPYGRDADN